MSPVTVWPLGSVELHALRGAVARDVFQRDAAVVVQMSRETTPTGVSILMDTGDNFAEVRERGQQADGSVAAHSEIPDVVEEDHARRAVFFVRLDQQRPDDDVRATWLVHRGRADSGRTSRGRSPRAPQSGPSPSSGPPPTIIRVGSPPVCESTIEIFRLNG